MHEITLNKSIKNAIKMKNHTHTRTYAYMQMCVCGAVTAGATAIHATAAATINNYK